MATLTSNNTSNTLNNAVKVYVDGNEATVESTSFATSVLGFDSSIDCWIPTKLASIELGAGSHTVELELQTSLGTSGLRISQFCFANMSAKATIA